MSLLIRLTGSSGPIRLCFLHVMHPRLETLLPSGLFPVLRSPKHGLSVYERPFRSSKTQFRSSSKARGFFSSARWWRKNTTEMWRERTTDWDQRHLLMSDPRLTRKIFIFILHSFNCWNLLGNLQEKNHFLRTCPNIFQAFPHLLSQFAKNRTKMAWYLIALVHAYMSY